MTDLKRQAEELVRLAEDARRHAYAPYSKFTVGAALLDSEGDVHIGVNVENSSFGLTICAERNAVAQAIAAGCRSFQMLAIVADSEEPISPCGACRQVLMEFAPQLRIVMATTAGAVKERSLSQLLPDAFSKFAPDSSGNDDS